MELAVREQAIEQVRTSLELCPAVRCPLRHTFTPGMYIRRIEMPAFTEHNGELLQTIIVSQKHKTRHPFVVTKGKCAVYNSADSFLGIIEAPYEGITPEGTQRVLKIIEDTVWTTFHSLPFIVGDENTWPKEQQDELVAMLEELLVGQIVEEKYK